MPSTNATTVVLTKKAQVLKDQIVLVHGGLKHPLSVAIEMFAALPLEEQIKRVSHARLSEAEEVVRDAEEQARARVKNRRQKNPE